MTLLVILLNALISENLLSIARPTLSHPGNSKWHAKLIRAVNPPAQSSTLRHFQHDNDASFRHYRRESPLWILKPQLPS